MQQSGSSATRGSGLAEGRISDYTKQLGTWRTTSATRTCSRSSNSERRCCKTYRGQRRNAGAYNTPSCQCRFAECLCSRTGWTAWESCDERSGSRTPDSEFMQRLANDLSRNSQLAKADSVQRRSYERYVPVQRRTRAADCLANMGAQNDMARYTQQSTAAGLTNAAAVTICSSSDWER